eukprot:scaffold10026_cov62-Phaeocystis_antarctica.AAC.5
MAQDCTRSCSGRTGSCRRGGSPRLWPHCKSGDLRNHLSGGWSGHKHVLRPKGQTASPLSVASFEVRPPQRPRYPLSRWPTSGRPSHDSPQLSPASATTAWPIPWSSCARSRAPRRRPRGPRRRPPR